MTFSGRARGAHGTEEATAPITYRTPSTVYVGAGASDGVVTGTLLRVATPAGTVVLEAKEVSPHRAACSVVSGDGETVGVGDAASWTPSLAPATSSGSGSRRGPGIHGRIGVRYLATRDGLNESAEFSQPGLDLRVDAPALHGSAWGVHVDARARRTTRTLTDGTEDRENRTRVYRLHAGWDRPGPGWRVAAGRQFVPDLANVSVFDGIVAARDGARSTFGGFAGTQPDGEDYGYASDVREYGAWYGWRAGAEASRDWSLTTGAVASYRESEIDREYVFVQGRFRGERLSALVTQEVDLNRDWKEDAGESTVEPTSTFASFRFRIGEAASLGGGFDNRRNVRLFRDRVTPVTEFDDAFRRGVWLGGQVGVGSHLRLGACGRTWRGAVAGSADSWTGTASFVRMTPANLDVRVRGTRYENDRLEGWLWSVDSSVDLTRRARVGVQIGTRDDTSLLNPDLDDSVTWYGLDLDVDLGRRLFATPSLERSEGDLEEVDQMYATLAWRF